MYRIPIEESYITTCLTEDNHKENWKVVTIRMKEYRQLSRFDQTLVYMMDVMKSFCMEVSLCIYLHVKTDLKI